MRPALVFLIALSGCRCGTAAVFPGDQAALICITLQTCSPREFQTTFGDSLEACTTTSSPAFPWPGTLETSPPMATGLNEPLRAIYQCLLEAHGDCASAGDCWAVGGNPGRCTNRWGVDQSSCTDQTLSGCTRDGQRFEVNCARTEAVCTSNAFGVSFNACAIATCPPKSELKCRGTQAELCSGNAVLLWDCARAGKKCEVLPDGGGATCVTGDRTCDPMAGRRCEGTVAIGCEGLGSEVRVDCAASPTHRRCDLGECINTGKTCAGLEPTCDDSSVQFCQDGDVRKVDCAGAGFRGCDAGRCFPK